MGTSFTPTSVVKRQPLNVESTPSALSTDVTPTEHFYVRTNFGVPRITVESYDLRLVALNGAEHRVSLDELRALGAVEAPVTLECAGNHRSTLVPLSAGETWRGGAVGTAVWTAVPLRRVLERYGLLDGASHLLFTGADNGTVGGKDAVSFQRSLSVQDLVAEPLLAFAMNGKPLVAEHGAPLRLVVPGWYAMASVKWLVSIEARDSAFAGHFQCERYVYRTAGGETPVRAMLVKSIVAHPLAEAIIPLAPVTLSGWAWSGAGSIARVEVALGGGDEWRPARLGPEQSTRAWRRWELDWRPEAAGHYILRSRATDASGATQPAAAEWNELGYGNNAVQTHSIFVV